MLVQNVPNVLKDAPGLVGAPAETGAEEGDEQHDAVVPLQGAAREVELVAEPVHVKEWGRKLVEDEDWAVVVDEWSL